MEVLGPKGPQRHTGPDLLPWARNQLLIASQIMDNPGGGLLFATQTVGQVRAALSESGADRWRSLVQLLDEVEDNLIRRRFDAAQALLERATRALADEQPAQA